MRLHWVNKGRVEAFVGDRMVVIGGEALLERDPDYVIYAETVTHWDDGAQIDVDERADLIDRVIEAAAQRGWKFEVDW
jgi:Immunity protein 74